MYSAVLIVGGLFALSLVMLALAAFTFFTKIKAAGKYLIVFLFISSFIYCFGYVLELSSTTLEGKLLFNNIQYGGLLAIAPLWYMVSVQFRNKNIKWTAAKVLPVFVIPVIALLANFTHEQNGLYYSSFYTVEAYGLTLLILKKGLIYYLSVAYQCFLEILAIGNYMAVVRQSTGGEKKQARMLLYLSIIGFVASAVCFIGMHTSYLDSGAIIISAVSLIMLVALFKYELFDLLPLAYSKVFEYSSNPIMILSDNLSIIKSNTEAQIVFSDKLKERRNIPLQDIFDDDPDFVNCLKMYKNCLINKTVGNERLYFSVSLVSLDFRNREKSKNFGYLLMFSNETLHINQVRSLENDASVDPLTGAFNRRYFFANAETLIDKARQEDKPSSVVMFDIDRFKRINDKFGHLAGDYILRVISEIIRGNLREGDLFARYGGEEFVAILPSTYAFEAKRIVGNIGTLIREREFKYDNKTIRVTLSGGVSTIEPLSGASLTECIALADSALYRAKEEGRDSVCLYLESSDETNIN